MFPVIYFDRTNVVWYRSPYSAEAGGQGDSAEGTRREEKGMGIKLCGSCSLVVLAWSSIPFWGRIHKAFYLTARSAPKSFYVGVFL